MIKAVLAGAFALATIGSSLAHADTVDVSRAQQAKPAIVLTHGQILRFKSVLRLTPEQEPFWPAVERAFHDMVKAQFQDEGSSGLIRSISHRAMAVGVSAVALQRLASAAYPLIQTLDAGQKQSAVALARSMGLESVASAF
jgi:hypothetical protein